jgi:crossover junction endodeoxyribonuclease RuvC
MIILSVDSGLERTGYAVFEHSGREPIYKTSGLIQTSRKKTTAERLLEIYNLIKHLIKFYKPDVIAMEQLFFFKNKKTVISVAQAQGTIQLLAAENKIPLEYLTPLQIKQIVTGYGQSDKLSIKKMVHITIPKLKEIAMIDDELDAIACGLAYCYLNKKLT